ncbi:MAG TPA: hypothetical protein DEP51_02620 [Clostridiales bacterium]|nr:hypothetical protein [Clostridiales bacterium]
MIFRIDLKIFLILILFYFTNQIEIYTLIMIFAIIHELSHLLAGLVLKMKIKRITLMPVGLSIEFKIPYEDLNIKILKSNKLELKKILITIAGPLINIIIIFMSLFLNIKLELKYLIIYSNLLIAVFNLLPIYPLDGGRIFKSAICLIKGKRKAENIINKISNIMFFLIMIIFSILIYYLKNISVLIIMFYLLYIVTKENKIYKLKNKMYEMIDRE